MEKYLDEAYSGKTQLIRKKALSNFLNNHNLGKLNENELTIFKKIFDKHYTPDIEETKYNIDLIQDVYISISFNNRYFRIVGDEIDVPCGIRWLSGATRTLKNKVTQAARNDISSQIKDFRADNLLDINDICPINGNELGFDAEVDHLIPFNELLKEFMKENNINTAELSGYVYYDKDTERRSYKEPYKTKWFDYHKQNAILRYLSKEGNKIAHLNYKLY